jgi:hypothetical protein
LTDAGSFAERARLVADGLDADERDMLLGWSESLIEIRSSARPRSEKARATLDATFDRDLLLLLGKVLFVEAKRSAWDCVSIGTRSVLIVAAVLALAWAGPLVGLAVLVMFFGVPLWLVFGQGFGYVKALRDELAARVPPDPTADVARPA